MDEETRGTKPYAFTSMFKQDTRSDVSLWRELGVSVTPLESSFLCVTLTGDCRVTCETTKLTARLRQCRLLSAILLTVGDRE